MTSRPIFGCEVFCFGKSGKNGDMSDPSTPFAAQLWADVGGTFTDCFLATKRRRRSAKVLSSGLVRGRVVAHDGDILTVAMASPQPPRFWTGAAYRLLVDAKIICSGTIQAQSIDESSPANCQFQVDQSLADLSLSPQSIACVIELDAGLESPVLAAHLLLGIPVAGPLPPLDVRLGTTRGTNALLTSSGAVVGLVTTLGFGDLLEIGEQSRPELFDLIIRKPEPLTRHVLEVDERLTAAGDVLRPLDPNSLRIPLTKWFDAGVRSLAICLLHAHTNSVHEIAVAEIAESIGFRNISVSSRVAPMVKLVARAETTVLDAYLTPILSQYVSRLREQFNRTAGGDQHASRIRLMSSGGNLVEADSFRGAESILSGPAGGVVALGKIADELAPRGAIGLDMGGTSTDVSRYAGRIQRDYESRKAGIRVLTPMMAIHTVAAGGGSICDVIGGRMTVGPRSAGADPGPACYGRGGPLTVTDVNVILGRLPGDRFPFPLDVAAARRRLGEVNEQLGDNRFKRLEDSAEGFLAIAITHMAEAVRTITTAQGSDPREFALAGFGGAAGGHLCAVAEALGISRIIDHRDASLLSALGIGLADVGRIKTRAVYQMLNQIDGEQWSTWSEQIQTDALSDLADESDDIATATCTVETELRYQGTEATLNLPLQIDSAKSLRLSIESLANRFHAAHAVAFGYNQLHRSIEIATLRCEATIAATVSLDPPSESNDTAVPSQESQSHITSIYHDGSFADVPLLIRRELLEGSCVVGPGIVVDDHSTLVIDPGWTATKLAGDTFELVRAADVATAPNGKREVDAVSVEVVARRMQGIADSMGELLRRTAASVNIRQRLDFSCAIFTARGELIANAPHVPVHLGAMGHTVREIQQAFPQMFPGDVYVSNNPYAGGSHLPDVTVVTPVFCAGPNVGEFAQGHFFVASRAHHAEIGGKTPGSMPPDATCLGEEGVVIDTFALVRQGRDATDDLAAIFTTGPYPSRDPQTNLADIAAQRAAGKLGESLLKQLVGSIGMGSVNQCVDLLFDHADRLVADWLATLAQTSLQFSDALDDGTRIAVRLQRTSDRLCIDFGGTAPVHPRCFNATPAIVNAATIYVLRCVIGGTLPMNDGIMRRVDLVLPIGLLNPPCASTPQLSPAVVAGNVETSMRVVDCLLGALGLVAASQGTMNNVLIGDKTFGYYETIGGGAGAGENGIGASGVHTHMTNTRITDPEVYEARYPVRLWRFSLRIGSGGEGLNRGGDGLIREIEFLKPLTLALITNRRGTYQPYGLAGGAAGSPGENVLVRASGEIVELPAATTIQVDRGDRFIIRTPGGGGWGRSS